MTAIQALGIVVSCLGGFLCGSFGMHESAVLLGLGGFMVMMGVMMAGGVIS